jgi:hypothetical protein
MKISLPLVYLAATSPMQVTAWSSMSMKAGTFVRDPVSKTEGATMEVSLIGYCSYGGPLFAGFSSRAVSVGRQQYSRLLLGCACVPVC